MAISPFELNLNDLFLLDEYRIDRLRCFFPESLAQSVVCVDCDNRLTIYCPEPSTVDTLLADVKDLCDCAWIILGVTAVSLFFAQEEIYHTRLPVNSRLTS
jgi:hypothetical protein